MKQVVLLASLFIFSGRCPLFAQQLTSPDGKLAVTVTVDKGGVPKYAVALNKTVVLAPSALGLMLYDLDLSYGLKLVATSPVTAVHDQYSLVSGKKATNVYDANKAVYTFEDRSGNKLAVVFQVSNDGVAFRYQFLGSPEIKLVRAEYTSFKLPDSARAFLQPLAVAKSGWEHTNPSYEEHYAQDVPVGTPASLGAGFVYPALFKVNNNWLLITEAAVGAAWCGTHLDCDSGRSTYKVAFPDSREVVLDGGLYPQQPMNGFSPWRIITVGSLKTIVESTLGTDLADADPIGNTSYIHPGKASWSWINSKDDFIVYDEQHKYIDFASDMHWQYCLIDVNWDRNIGYDKIKELADYAKGKNVGLILWYNSAGDWNTVKYTPRNKLLTSEARKKEFAILQSMGIKGVKIDFMGGDGQSVMKYYEDILRDAAAYQLMVNFHGATLPRGLSRTFPNLVTQEAIMGMEFVTFDQRNANAQANHATMLPFTRNAFDPMDFTPMNLYKLNTNVVRKTTSAFELATTVTFLSGVQHMAESPDGMSHVPAFAKEYLRNLPDTWDETRFIDGFPGKLVVLARRSGSKWYIAAMNGENKAKQLRIDLSFLKNRQGNLMTDDEVDLLKQATVNIPANGILPAELKPNGGLVMVIE
ncbi:glycoside hydrolase family 97 protein [Chitinophaga sp. Cy-1792]|uniref:glycoside hydrolase family 97 protein n=1 Tax=Chitinophaga sp. Cy-1792 TaxID=2608339 RepID=UPI00142076D4|nr:glycoside hydrolase family 97 protein [Chitinophaga sp. Cy-1792]